MGYIDVHFTDGETEAWRTQPPYKSKPQVRWEGSAGLRNWVGAASLPLVCAAWDKSLPCSMVGYGEESDKLSPNVPSNLIFGGSVKPPPAQGLAWSRCLVPVARGWLSK